ncbi:T9SS type A sorting domain-containing protein [Polaribacter pectinis]|uniref:T9SS type A sorting domain-containing protein n=1 Tax=Polaribacter pectinis TaxID=2738844 RepID=A0A7G9L6M5_9FLAO|nr:T9SS type A sorting domain-containing protein [Polaribacter pectinis]QNM84274.1 T9SS type A sorting domain-containing protein [Polaribacter pectinis]
MNAQTTIYSENFTGQNDKGAVGPAPTTDLVGVDWTIDVSSAALTASTDWFKVTSEVFEARDIDGDAIWMSPSINITGFTGVSFSLSAAESGTMEAADIFNTEYRIDGGAWTAADTNGTLNDDFTSATVSQAGLAGSTLEIRVTMNNNSGTELQRLDDVLVQGTASTAPTVGFDNAASNQTETNASFNVSIPVTVSNYDGNQIDVSIASSGTAEPADFTLNTATLSFTADGSQNISLDINPDTDDFDDETIILTLTETSAVTGLIVSQATHTVTVTEDETAPSIGFDAATSSENETDATFTSANIPITVSNYSGTQIDIDVTATVGTAEAGDFTFTSPTALSFTADGTQNITFSINDDADTDPETIIFTITETSAVSGLIISQATHTVTIIDDEIPPLPIAGKVFITEIVDAASTAFEYLELFNNSSEAVSLYSSKLVRADATTNASQYVFDFGVDEQTADTDLIIPAYGFLIVARGGTRSGFNSDFGITLDASVNYNGGHSSNFFGTGRRWRLMTGGTANTDDGTLIDDTLIGLGTEQDYKNIFTNSYVVEGDVANATPGALEYLIYSGGAWVNSVALDGTTTAKDAYIYDDLVISANTEANDIGIADTKGIDVSAGNSLTINGNLTLAGSDSYLQGNGTVPSAGVVNSASVILKGTYTSGGTNQFFYFTETYHNNTTGLTDGWSLISSPTVGEKIDGNTGDGNFTVFNGLQEKDSQYGIAVYDNTQSDTDLRWDYFSTAEVNVATASATIDMASGKGYSVLPSATPTADQQKGNLGFKGSIATIDVGSEIKDSSPANGGVGNAFNAIGNPYPAFLPFNTTADATDNLLTVNTGVLDEETLWIWDKATTSYLTVNQTTTVGTDKNNNERTSLFIAPAQGFFVKAKSMMAPSDFNFTKAMQKHQATGIFNRTENTRPEIKLSLSKTGVTKNAFVYYYDGKTTGFDNGYDSSAFAGLGTSFGVHTQLVTANEGKKLAIQTLPKDNYEAMVIPVGVHAAANEEITFSANVLNLPSNIKVYLEDRELGTFTRLDAANSTYKVTLTANLSDIGRFYLHTTESTLSVKDVVLNTVSIFKTAASTIRMTGLPQGKTTFSLYSMLGKQVYTSSFETNGVKDATLPKLGTGVYFVKVQTETGKVSKKIILE